MKIIYIARCDYNQVFLGDFVFLSSVFFFVARHKNSDHFPKKKKHLLSLSPPMYPSLYVCLILLLFSLVGAAVMGALFLILKFFQYVFLFAWNVIKLIFRIITFGKFNKKDTK